jgi:hypothetical protein
MEQIDFKKWFAQTFVVLRSVKPFADVVAPLALVFFAYQADRIYHQVAATQALQAEMQAAQTLPALAIGYQRGTQLTLSNYGAGPMYDLHAVIKPFLYVDVQTLKETGIEDQNAYYAVPIDVLDDTGGGYVTNAIVSSASYDIGVKDLITTLNALIPPDLPQGKWPSGATQTAIVKPVISLHVSYNTGLGRTTIKNYYIHENQIIDYTIERAKVFPVSIRSLTLPSIAGVEQALEAMGWRRPQAATQSVPERATPQHRASRYPPHSGRSP